MTTETLTLSQFLLERIAEWEKVAGRAGSFTPWDEDFQNDNYGHLTVQPSVILATCKAHRAIVELHSPSSMWCGWSQDSMATHDGDACDTLRALASIYADDPAFDSRWAL